MFSLIALLIGLYKIPHISKRIMKQVIFLFETMEDILESSSKQKNQKNFQLSFKASSAEVNSLHLTFNKVAKTTRLAEVASEGFKEGKEYETLLQLNEAYQIFKDFENNR